MKEWTTPRPSWVDNPSLVGSVFGRIDWKPYDKGEKVVVRNPWFLVVAGIDASKALLGSRPLPHPEPISDTIYYLSTKGHIVSDDIYTVVAFDPGRGYRVNENSFRWAHHWLIRLSEAQTSMAGRTGSLCLCATPNVVKRFAGIGPGGEWFNLCLDCGRERA